MPVFDRNRPTDMFHALNSPYFKNTSWVGSDNYVGFGVLMDSRVESEAVSVQVSK